MDYETKIVKGTTKKYNTVSGEKVSISKRIDLGVNSLFDVNDEVVILSYDTLNDLIEGAGVDSIDKLESIYNKDKALENENKKLYAKINELMDLLSMKDDNIDELVNVNNTNNVKIRELEKDVAVFESIDVNKLRGKVDELDLLKDKLLNLNERLDNKSNVISLLQNQIMEYIQLVNYKNSIINALEKQGVLSKLMGKDVRAGLIKPSLFLINETGNLKDDVGDDLSGDD